MPLPRFLATLREARDALIFLVEVAVLVGVLVYALTEPAESPIPRFDPFNPWSTP